MHPLGKASNVFHDSFRHSAVLSGIHYPCKGACGCHYSADDLSHASGNVLKKDGFAELNSCKLGDVSRLGNVSGI